MLTNGHGITYANGQSSDIWLEAMKTQLFANKLCPRDQEEMSRCCQLSQYCFLDALRVSGCQIQARGIWRMAIGKAELMIGTGIHPVSISKDKIPGLTGNLGWVRS
jgi:hypothetical protein